MTITRESVRSLCCLLLLGVLGVAPGSADNCGPPNFPPNSMGTNFTFADLSMQRPGTCSPQIAVDFQNPYFDIWKLYPCTGDKVLLYQIADDTAYPSINRALASICGAEWVSDYIPFPSTPGINAPVSGVRGSDRAAASSVLPASGQGSQQFLIADLNGDGNPDAVIVFGQGVLVELLGSDGSVLSSNEYKVGFPISNQLASSVIAADFNADGKLDLAISNIGNPGSDPGGIAILLGKGDGTFGAPTAVSAGLNPLSLAASDFNGDGKIDLAAANQYSAMMSAAGGPGTISVLLGNGDGTFAAPVTYATGEDAVGFPDSLLALDLNGDGRPDLAVANRNDNSVSTLINAGAGKFNQAVVTSLPVGVEYLAFADFNHDGKQDLAATSEYSSALVMLLGNGDGTFQTPAAYATANNPGSIGVLPVGDGNTLVFTGDSIAGSTWTTVVSPQGTVGAPPLNFIGGPGSPPRDTGVAVADLNGDGQPDAVVTSASSDVLVLLSQNGQYNTSTGYSLGSPSPMPAAVAIGDLNNDGKLDVVVANEAGSVSVLLGNGDGTLQAPTSTTITQNADSIALGDFNGDGKLDAVVAAYGSNDGTEPGGVVVLLGNGDGTFQTPVTLTLTGLHPEAVATADLNGDGILDLATVAVGTSGQPATLAIFLGQSGGMFQAGPIYPLQATGGSQSGVAIGDLNGDGKPDIVAFSDFGQKIDVLLGDGTGNFRETPTIPTTFDSYLAGVALADVNGDKKLDIVLNGSYLLGNGDGTFQSEQQYLAGSFPDAVAVTKLGPNPAFFSVDQAKTMVVTELLTPSPSALTIAANVSAASSTVTMLAPASIATAFGSNLATGTAAATTSTLPTSLSQTTVTITDSSGAQKIAPLFYVSPTQINYEVPAGTATGTAQVTIATGSGLQGSANVQIANVAPGIFALTSGGLAAADVLVVGANGSQKLENIYQLGPSNSVQPLPIDLSMGQIYLEIFGTGIRNAKNVTATVGGQSVPVLSAGAQGTFVGLDQVNIGPMPSSLKGTGQVNILLNGDGQAANTVNVTFK